MKLDAQTLAPQNLSPECVGQMYRLMAAHYEGVSEAQFAVDLAAKQWVILLRDAGQLCGFSTQVVFDHAVGGRSVKIMFSGDTIIDKGHWGSVALPVAWGRLMLSILAANPGVELYWLLTSKGYKTYRFLPVFFHEFFPCHARETPPFEAVLLRSAALARFGVRFDPAAGILHAQPGAQRLREGIADLDEARLRDPHIAYFQQRNPGHRGGDELVCLARFHPDNLHPFIQRQL
jgi:hypothetical protein